MFINDLWSHVLYDDQRSANASTITGDVNCFVMVMNVNSDKLVDLAGPS